jgi:glutamate/tyrosine decarboxylase-like PLP-dependent enzyme
VPSLELTRDQRDSLGRAALEWVQQYFDKAGRPPLYPSVSAEALRARVSEPLPQTPQDPARVLEEFAQLAALGRNNGHPRMLGYVQSSGNFAAAIGDFLASALNQNVTSWRSAPSATTVEWQVIDWIKTFVGVDPAAAGILVGGGSAANAAALATALCASTTVDVMTQGVAALPGPPRIYASERVHMSVPKAAGFMGLGRAAVRPVRTGADGRMDVAALAQLIAADRAMGVHPVCVVANAGDVNTGAIDPIDELADLCARQRIWFHVDGAYGGFAAGVPSLASAFAGMSRADSLALDPHKWLFAPVDVGCLLVRDQRHLRAAFSQSAAYIDVVADREMSDFAFWDVSPELSRRFRALKVWFALKCHGANAFRQAIEHNVTLARQLAAAIDAAGDFERLADVPLSIVCFRYVPPGPRPGDETLNALNRRLMVEVQRRGDSYVSNAAIGETFALRACLVNHRTTQADLPALLDDIRRAATALV